MLDLLAQRDDRGAGARWLDALLALMRRIREVPYGRVVGDAISEALVALKALDERQPSFCGRRPRLLVQKHGVLRERHLRKPEAAIRWKLLQHTHPGSKGRRGDELVDAVDHLVPGIVRSVKQLGDPSLDASLQAHVIRTAPVPFTRLHVPVQRAHGMVRAISETDFDHADERPGAGCNGVVPHHRAQTLSVARRLEVGVERPHSCRRERKLTVGRG